MVRDLVIHLGDCKTGSTSIQTVLAGDAWHAPGRSLCYPTAFNHNNAVHALRRPPAARDAVWRRLASRLADSTAQTGVISAEHFEYADPKALAALFDGPLKPWRGKTRLIAYVRPHAQNLISTYGTRITLGAFTGDLDSFHAAMKRKSRLLYAPRLTAWQEVFGPALTVRPYSRDRLEGGDAVQDFLGFVLEGPVSLPDRARVNTALSVPDLALVRHCQTLIRGDADRPLRGQDKAGRSLAGQLAATGGAGDRLALHRALAETLHDTYAADAEAVDRRFVDGPPLFVPALEQALEEAVADPVPLDAALYHDPETLRWCEAWALTMREQLEDGQRDRSRKAAAAGAPPTAFARLRETLKTALRRRLPPRA